MKTLGSETSPRSLIDMKSTAITDTRTEQPKVSRNTPQTSHEISSSQRKGSTNSRKNAAATIPNVKIERKTCSSSLKDRKLHENIKKNPEHDVKVCRYSYCSFNGHLCSRSPPLKGFVSERRRALKAKGSKNPPNCAETRGREGIKQNGDINSTVKQIKPDIITGSDERFGWFFDEIGRDEASSQDSFNEDSINWDSVCSKQTAAKNGSSFEGNQTRMDEEKPTLKDKSLSNEDVSTQIRTIKHGNKDYMLDQAENSDGARNTKTQETKDESSTRAKVKSKPHLMPMEQEPGAEEGKLRHQELEARENTEEMLRHQELEARENPEEKMLDYAVMLRHQELEARQNPEEWMVDYAIRQAVKKGGTTARASQRNVAIIVQAFERVVPNTRTLNMV